MFKSIQLYFLKGTYLPFVIGLLSGLGFITFKVTGFSLAYFPGDFIDARFNNYILEHAFQFLTFQIKDFWNAPFMFPEKDVVTYSDNLLGTAPFYAIFRVFGYDRETSFQLWFILITVLNYTAAYVLLNYLFKNKLASVIGAMIFAFSLSLQCQMGHAQTYTRFPMVLAILASLVFSKNFEVKWFFVAIFLLVYQLYCGIYLGFLLMFPIGVFMLTLFITKRQFFIRKVKEKKWLLWMIVVLVVNAVLLLPLILPYLERAKLIGFYSYQFVVNSIPTPMSYFFSWRGSLFWDMINETCIKYPAFWDHMLFSGGIATIGIIFFVFLLPFTFLKQRFNKQNPEQLNYFLLWITCITTFIFFLRIEQFSVYRLLFTMPGYGSMRALQRVINFELIFFSIGVAYLIHMIKFKKPVMHVIIFILLVVLVISDNYVKDGFIHQRRKDESQKRISDLVLKIKDLPKQSILSFEPDTFTSNPTDYHLDAMLASQSISIKTLNGYSATSPGGYGDYWAKPNAQSRRIWLDRKQADSSNIVVVH